MKKIKEDAPVNVSGGIAGTGGPAGEPGRDPSLMPGIKKKTTKSDPVMSGLFKRKPPRNV